MELLKKSKEEVLKLLSEDIQGLTYNVLETLKSLKSIDGSDLIKVSDLIQQMKSANVGAQSILKELNERDNKKHI